MTDQTHRSKRLASLEDELRDTCQRFLDLQYRLTTQPPSPDAVSDDRILKALLAALSQVLNAFGDQTAQGPNDLSLLAVYVFLPSDLQRVEILSEAAALLQNVADLVRALVEERAAETGRNRGSMPPDHKKSGTRRIRPRESSSVGRRRSTLPPSALDSFSYKAKKRFGR